MWHGVIFEGTRLVPPRRFSKMLHSWCSLSRFWRREVAAATDRPSDGPRWPRWRQVVAELKPEEREHVTEAISRWSGWFWVWSSQDGWKRTIWINFFFGSLKSFILLYPWSSSIFQLYVLSFRLTRCRRCRWLFERLVVLQSWRVDGGFDRDSDSSDLFSVLTAQNAMGKWRI